jgi:hypothetical protein
MFLRQSTASQEISLGYFLDTTDGNSSETGLTIANTDIKIRKGGGTTLTNKNSGGATHISDGIYSAVLDATDTNTLGDLVIYCHPTGALATKIEYTVLPAASYDALIVNGLNDLSAAQVNTEVDTGLSDYDAPTNAEMEARTIASADYSTATNLATVDTVVDAILVDTGTTLPATLTDMSGASFSTSTDSLEALRNRGDSAWATGGGGSAPTVEQIRTEMDDNSTKLAAILLDTAEIANVPTVTQFNARTLLAASYFDPGSDAVANVTLVDTTTTNTDMRGTNSALLSSGYTSPDNAGITSNGNAIGALNNLSAAQVNTQVDTALTDYDGPTNSEMEARTIVSADYATATAVADVPTVAEFNARTLVAANYFDPAADTVARVTLVDTTTTNTDMLSASDVLTTQMTESYAADNTAPTLAQAIFLSMQNLQDFSFAGTTQTVKKIDGSTTAATYTLDDASEPTSKTRAT